MKTKINAKRMKIILYGPPEYLIYDHVPNQHNQMQNQYKIKTIEINPLTIHPLHCLVEQLLQINRSI